MCGCFVLGPFCGVVLGLAIILLRKRMSWLLSFTCDVAVCVLCLFLTVPWVAGLRLRHILAILTLMCKSQIPERKSEINICFWRNICYVLITINVLNESDF